MKNIEIFVERNEFKNFLIEEKNALEENSLTIARSKRYDSDGLKMVVDYDENHYSIRVEDFETSDIEFEHLYDDKIDLAETFYDTIMTELERHVVKSSNKKDYIICARCHSRINPGDDFLLQDSSPLSPSFPVCMECPGDIYILQNNDLYIDEFWRKYGDEWANDADDEYEAEEISTENKFTIYFQDGEGGSGAYYTGNTVEELVNNFAEILKHSLNYYVNERGCEGFDIVLTDIE